MSKTNYRSIVFLSLVILTLTGCTTHKPSSDTIPPEITLTVRDAHGNNIFKSVDGEHVADKNCIRVPGTPTRLKATARDAGGVSIFSVKVLPGRIVKDSVEINPDSSASSYSLRTMDGADILDIKIEPSSEGEEIKEVTAIFDVSGELPTGITATAGDHSGNVSNIPQVDIREPSDLTPCRGN